MRIPLFKLVLTREAEDFLRSLPLPARDKMAHNIQRIAKGERNSDIFKKLENTEIWEFRTLFNKTAYRLFAFLGYGRGDAGDCHAWHHQENTKDSRQGNSKGGSYTESIL